MTKRALPALLVGLGLALAGCAGSGDHRAAGSGSPSPRAPHSSPVVLLAPRVLRGVKLTGVGARFVSPTTLAFLTSGSGSCRSVPYRLTVESRDSVRIDLRIAAPKGGACTLNLVIAPFAIAIDPTRIDVHRPLRVALRYPRSKHPVVFTAPAL